MFHVVTLFLASSWPDSSTPAPFTRRSPDMLHRWLLRLTHNYSMPGSLSGALRFALVADAAI